MRAAERKKINQCNKPRGRPFPKGVSGNPAGRPRRLMHDQVVTAFIELMIDKQGTDPDDPNNAAEVLKRLFIAQPKAVAAALTKAIVPPAVKPLTVQLDKINLDEPEEALAQVMQLAAQGEDLRALGEVVRIIEMSVELRSQALANRALAELLDESEDDDNEAD